MAKQAVAAVPVSANTIPGCAASICRAYYAALPSLVIAAFLSLLLSTASAFAWGSEGHRIVAELAEQYLEPGTARQVRELLAIENATTLAQLSTWADEIRRQRRETERCHYVNIPLHPPRRAPAAYDAARDCP